ncbi:hypothetical protein MtrunA17_Chr4g0063181 [Medicago truncatula]|uniref:Uncharacterized protein n=1 Tax=Medicago truncatula TaxID=3880 RepID=A0A396IGE2_MEDTR|nr:hypothetical protein MtrunA17_Chr4g0063181 [Medicago truncatula]
MKPELSPISCFFFFFGQEYSYHVISPFLVYSQTHKAKVNKYFMSNLQIHEIASMKKSTGQHSCKQTISQNRFMPQPQTN